MYIWISVIYIAIKRNFFIVDSLIVNSDGDVEHFQLHNCFTTTLSVISSAILPTIGIEKSIVDNSKYKQKNTTYIYLSIYSYNCGWACNQYNTLEMG